MFAGFLIMHFITWISFIVAFIRVHISNFYCWCVTQSCDMQINEDIGIDIEGVWCIHMHEDCSMFKQHEITERFLQGKQQKCTLCTFLAIDYQIINPFNSNSKTHTFFMGKNEEFETCSMEDLILAPPQKQFTSFKLFPRTPTLTPCFDLTTLMNKAIGPLSDFQGLDWKSVANFVLLFFLHTTDKHLFKKVIDFGFIITFQLENDGKQTRIEYNLSEEDMNVFDDILTRIST